MPHIDAADINKEIEDSAKIKDEMFGAMARVELALKPVTRATPTASPAVVPKVSAKLPKLNIKHDNGTLTGWSPFWDAYKTAIHDDVSLSDTDKFNYFQSLLDGRARDAFSGLSLTDANYTIAVDILQHMFGDKERTIAAHMEDLMALESVSSDFHLGDLRRLYDKTEGSIHSLDALGVTVELMEPCLLQFL